MVYVVALIAAAIVYFLPLKLALALMTFILVIAELAVERVDLATEYLTRKKSEPD